MASGFFKRAMVYLGLVDDEYDEYDEYEPRAAVGQRLEPAGVAGGRGRGRAHLRRGHQHHPALCRARTTCRHRHAHRHHAAVWCVPWSPSPGARVHVVAPMQFGDARQIADRLMANQPVIVNLQVADRELMRRMIDFCSGVAYALSGKMERVADKVFLVTPSNVKVSAEERQRLQENGLLRP